MNSLIERVKTAMVGIGTGWILVLMLLLSIVSLAIMLERTWLYWSLRDDLEELMRTHGVPSFPDPKFAPGGRGVMAATGPRVDPSSPAFERANRECEDVGTPIPGGG